MLVLKVKRLIFNRTTIITFVRTGKQLFPLDLNKKWKRSEALRGNKWIVISIPFDAIR